MPTQTDRPINQPRRKDRVIEDEAWISTFLQRAPAASIATQEDGQPFLNTNLFVYAPDQHAIYFHTGRGGRIFSNIERNPHVCLTVYEMGRLLPADTALEFSVEYASVVVFGRASVLADPEEARQGLQILLDKYFPHLRPERDYRPIQDEEMKRTAVYKIEIDAWSAKRKQAAADFLNAFRFGEHDGESG